MMLAQFMAAASASLACFYMLRSSYGPLFDTRLLKKMLLFSAPLVPAGFLVFLNLYVNRLALNHFMSLEEVGVFGIASRIAGIAALLIIGIRAALTPLIYENHRRPETPGEIATLFGWFLAFAFPACLGLSVFAREAILVLAKPAYAEAASLVIYLAPAMLMSQMYIFAPGIAITKKTYWQFWLTLASASVSVIANLVLVPLAGVTGAAIATLASALVFFFGWVWISQRLYPVPYAWSSAFVAMLCFAGLSTLGIWIDASSMPMWLALTAKISLLLAMSISVVALKLLPAADMRKLALSVTGRLSRLGGRWSAMKR
ncbi:polysaccharide biosynthesis C-terminal domain-containing protein [Alloalcanivorax venustensis]|uniref:polysaccharide biosynthesis C-terminal domain-containing protein n=1 Tax=Alloalcanivorax venustensis TaxID=172371 RepID=UPI003C46B064